MDSKPYAVCPYLGLENDPTSIQAQPTSEHRCYAQKLTFTPEIVHQSSCCLNANFVRCPFYVELPTQAADVSNSTTKTASRTKHSRGWRLPRLWGR